MTDTPKKPSSGKPPFNKSGGHKGRDKPAFKSGDKTSFDKTRKPSGKRTGGTTAANSTGFKSRPRPGYVGSNSASGEKGARDFNDRDAELAIRRLPSPTLTRLYAARAVQLVLRDKITLETAFEQQGYNDLDGRDRAFARLIAATTFRRWGQIGAVLKPMLKSKPPVFVMSVLETATAQMLFLDTGPHAAVSEAVNVLKASNSTRGFSGLCNAVLRRVSEEGQALAGSTAPSANFPRWLTTSWEKAYSRVDVRKMSLQLIKDPPLDLSVKSDPEGWAEKLDGKVLPTGTVRLEKIGDVTALEGFDDGQWWAQDVAASLPVKALIDGFDVSGKRILDMCAAPGGKTLQLAAMGAHVTALDISESRLGRLHENLGRTQLTAEVAVGDARKWQRPKNAAGEGAAQYDAILLDAPCSATGTFRRHPDVLFNKLHTDIGKLASLQDKLLLVAAHHLAPGGHLIFCTCSLQPEEGEARIKHFMKNRTDFRLNPILEASPLQALGVVTSEGFVRSLPHYLGTDGGMDGFFIARLTRNAAEI